ncbi:MAG: DUF4129 domain-containing protein [Acidimicrobiales bacterium]
MTSVTGGEIDSSTLLSRRLSVLPAILGLVAIIVLVATGRLVLSNEPEWPRTVVIVAALAVIVTVVSGYPVGLYSGLALFGAAIVGGQVSDSTVSLALAVVAMVVAHELVRVSLDARRPTRFGPRFWTRFFVRTATLALLVIGITFFAGAMADVSLPTWLVPIAITVAALPLVAHRFVGRLAVLLSALLALTLAGVVTMGAVLGSTARSQIERSDPPVASSDASSPTTTAPVVEPALAEASSLEPIAAVALFFVVMLIVGAILIALRRREMTFDLDEIDMDLDETALGFTGPGQADLDDEIEIDQDTIARLLADLALDMSTEPDAGRAVRYAYANTERRLGELGVVRAESETEQEFLARAMPSLGGEADAMIELTTLFERARFGHVPVSESMRERAIDAVGRLRSATGPVTASVATDTGADDREIDEQP